MQTLQLSTDHTGAWHFAFVPEELLVFVGFAAPGSTPDPIEGMTLEDFLFTRPRNALQQEAHAKLVSLLASMTSGSS